MHTSQASVPRGTSAAYLRVHRLKGNGTREPHGCYTPLVLRLLQIHCQILARPMLNITARKMLDSREKEIMNTDHTAGLKNVGILWSVFFVIALILLAVSAANASPTRPGSAAGWMELALKDTQKLVSAGTVKPPRLTASRNARSPLLVMLNKQVKNVAVERLTRLDRTQRRLRLRESIRKDIDTEMQNRDPERAVDTHAVIAQASASGETSREATLERNVSLRTLSATDASVSRLLDRTSPADASSSTLATKSATFDGVAVTSPEIRRRLRRRARHQIKPVLSDESSTSVIDENPISGIDNGVVNANTNVRLPGDRPAPTLSNADTRSPARAPTRRTTR